MVIVFAILEIAFWLVAERIGEVLGIPMHSEKRDYDRCALLDY